MINALYRLVLASGVNRAALGRMAVLAIISSLLAALPPHFLGAVVNVAAGGGKEGGAPTYSPIGLLEPALEAATRLVPSSPILVFCLLFFVFSCLAVVARNLFVVYVSVCADKFIAHARAKALETVVRAKDIKSGKWESGDIVHRVMNDTKQLEYLVGPPLYVLCSDVFDLLCVSLFILLLDWKMLCILLSTLPILYVLGKKTGRRQRALARTAQETEARCTGFVQRVFSGLDTVKVFAAEQKECRDFSRLIGSIYSLNVKSSLNLGTFFCLEGALRAAGTIGVIAYAAILAGSDAAYAGAIPVLIIYTQRFYAPLTNWTRFYQVIQKSIVSFRRVHDVFSLAGETEPCRQPAEPAQGAFPLEIDGGIELEPGRRVSLRIRLERPGLVVLRGRSGVGKTRFVKALLSLGDTFDGELRLGAQRFSGADLPAARGFFAHASQEAHFLPGTVAENLAYPTEGAAIDHERCRELLAALDLRLGPDDDVREYGGNLSLGEGRRLILGRALYTRRPILVLDEIDANVDIRTREKIYALVAREKELRPVLMITHANEIELAGVEHAVVVLEN